MNNKEINCLCGKKLVEPKFTVTIEVQKLYNILKPYINNKILGDVIFEILEGVGKQ